MKKLSGRSAYTQTTKEGCDEGVNNQAARSLLTKEDIQKFQALYLEQYGVEISAAEAFDQGLKLLTLMRCIYKPMTEEEFERTDAHRVKTIGDVINHLAVK